MTADRSAPGRALVGGQSGTGHEDMGGLQANVSGRHPTLTAVTPADSTDPATNVNGHVNGVVVAGGMAGGR